MHPTMDMSQQTSTDALYRVQKDYERAISNQYDDPVTSLAIARRVVEDIGRQLVRNHTPYNPEDKTLNSLIKVLSNEKVLPPSILAPFRTVQSYGNIGAHPQEKHAVHITPEYVRSCLYSLTTIVRWYIETYHPENAEEQMAESLTTPDGQQETVSVFIRSSSLEPEFSLSLRLEDALRQSGYDVFIDRGSSEGKVGIQQLRKALKNSHYVILLLSPETAGHEMTLELVTMCKELAYFHQGRPWLLPVQVGFQQREALPYHLALRLEGITQEQWQDISDSDRLTKHLLSVIPTESGWQTGILKEPASEETQTNTPQPYSDPRELMIPGGALDVNSRLYIERPADQEIFQTLKRPRTVVSIRGARQIGKTSLVSRLHWHHRQQGRSVFIDFQALPHRELESLDMIWRTIIRRMIRQLQITEWKISEWDDQIEYDENIMRFLEDGLFLQSDSPVLLCFDEVERVFGTPVQSEFFASIRAFYNSGAIDPLWKKVNWVLVTSSEPGFFIRDLNQSPFNIGLKVELKLFTCEEVATFAERHNLQLEEHVLEKIMEYVGGHPYLVHLLLYQIACHPESQEQLFHVPAVARGIFRDHLHRYLLQFQQEPALSEAMMRVIVGEPEPDVVLLNRLEAAGLIRTRDGETYVPLCRLYEEYFGNEL